MAEITNTKNVAELEYKYILLASYLMHTDLEGNAFKFRFSDIITFLNGVYATKAEMTTALAQLSQYTTKGYVDSLVGQSAKKTYVDAKDAEILRLIDGINKGSLNVYPTDSPSNGIDVYNALVAGTYTNFGGFVVTPEEIGANLVRFVRRKGVWEKILVATPLTGFAPVFSNDLNSTTSGRKLIVSTGPDGKLHISNILDTVTGENITATETDSTEIVDNIIYFEYAGKKYERDINTALKADITGLKETIGFDNSPLIQTAQDLAVKTDNNIELPNKKIELVSSLTLIGTKTRGRKTTIINKKSSGKLISIGSNTVIEEVIFDGGFLSTLTSGTRQTLDINPGSINIKIIGCEFFNHNKVPIIGYNLTDFELLECNFYENGENLQLYDGGKNITVDSCTFRNGVPNPSNNGGNAMAFNRSANTHTYKNTRIINNEIENILRMGIECFNLVDSEISNNFLRNIGDMGLSFPVMRNTKVTFNNIEDVHSYGIELPGAVGGNEILYNNISNPKDNPNLSEGLILTSFNDFVPIGAYDNRNNKIQGNTFRNWANDLGTRSSIKVQYGNNTESPLNDSHIEIDDNRFINSGNIIFNASSGVNQIITNNKFNINSRTRSLNSFITLNGFDSVIKDNIVFISGVVPATPLTAPILLGLCSNITISDNILVLNSSFNFGVKDTADTTRAAANVNMVNNKIEGYVTDIFEFKANTSSIKRYSNNGVLKDINNLYSAGNGIIEVNSFPGGSLYTGALNPEGLFTAKLGSVYLRAASRPGLTASMGVMYVKNHQVGSQDTNIGWSLVSAPIIDGLITSVGPTFSELNTKYPFARYPALTQLLLTNVNGGSLWVRLSDSLWVNLNKVAAASSNTAIAAVGANPTTAEFNALLNDFKDLKLKLVTAGLQL